MNKLNIYCLSLYNEDLNKIKSLGYIPVGLGEKKFNSEWLRDYTHKNISKKNKFYGEYTFHYWLWKNNKINFDGWIGFCQYRKFWKKNYTNHKVEDFFALNNTVLKEIPTEFAKFESIIGEKMFINQFRFSKFIKHNFRTMLANPSFFFDKNKRTIKFHFDMMHGHGNLDKAIELLNKEDRGDFNEFVNTEVSFNPHNMFLCKNKEILFSYYESLFPWLINCEKIFGFKNLQGFGLQRIYGFLAERYMSYWFIKYTKTKILPIVFFDINKKERQMDASC